MSSEVEPARNAKVLVSKNQLKAWIKLLGVGSAEFQVPTAESLIRLLEQTKIAVDDDVRERVNAIIAQCQQATPEAPAPEEYLVAEGEAPVEAEDGYFAWAPELKAKLEQPADDAQVNYFAMNAIISVAAGNRVGQLIAPTDGQAGVNVFGGKVSPRRTKGTPVRLGPGLKLASADSSEVLAETDGRIAEEQGKVRLYEVLDVPGDVSFESGSIDAVVDVAVHGSIRANFTVKTQKGLTVERLVEPSEVEAGGDISIRGGVFGREDYGYLKGGGDVAANFFNDTRVKAGGTLRFEKEILNSQIRAGRHVIGERGTIIGGDVRAVEGLEAEVIGSEADVTTCIMVGTDINVLRRVRRMETEAKELRKTAEKIRESTKPLVANMKRLLAQQREQLTELLSKADEIDIELEDSETRRSELLAAAAPQGEPYVLINEAIHAGTILVIQGREIHVQNLMHGPIKIEIRKVDNVSEVVAVNQRTGSVTRLPAVDADLNAPPEKDCFESEGTHGANEPSANH